MSNRITEESNEGIIALRNEYCKINLYREFVNISTPHELDILKEKAIQLGFYEIARDFQTDWDKAIESEKEHEKDRLFEQGGTGWLKTFGGR